jgi:hypothetical protein
MDGSLDVLSKRIVRRPRTTILPTYHLSRYRAGIA